MKPKTIYFNFNETKLRKENVGRIEEGFEKGAGHTCLRSITQEIPSLVRSRVCRGFYICDLFTNVGDFYSWLPHEASSGMDRTEIKLTIP